MALIPDDRFGNFDLDFRAASYFVRRTSTSSMLQHIRGHLRREMARDAFGRPRVGPAALRA